MARLFDAAPAADLAWGESIWPGDQVPVVCQDGFGRRLRTMAWELPQALFKVPLASAQRATLYSRDLVNVSRLRDPVALRRCLIVVEAFAKPVGQERSRTRQWTGLWDFPLVAWAGYCTPDGRHCAGLVQRTMSSDEAEPRLLRAQHADDWLAGAGLLMMGPGFAPEDCYHEDLGERWSTGRQDVEVLPLFAA